MRRKLGLIGALIVLVMCVPTALPRNDDPTPAASLGMPASSDLITLREGGAQGYVAVRKVATGELVRQLPEGVLLPDRRTIAVVEPAVSTTTFRLVDRLTGRTLNSRSFAGSWALPQGIFGYPTASPDGAFIVLTGSSYNFTDETGKWTARTSFAVVDTAFKFLAPSVVELNGRNTFLGISDDGSSLYVSEATPPELPVSSRLRVYDLRSRTFAALTGDEAPSPDSYFRTTPVSIGSYSYEIFAGRSPKLVRRDLNARTVKVLALPEDQGKSGESVLMWTLAATRDGGTLYAVNAALGVIDEVDPSSLTLRRTARLVTANDRAFVFTLVNYMHPVAHAKRGFAGAGAVLSPDETTLYAIGETGVWAIDTRSLSGRALTKVGAYSSIALGPDATVIYVLGFEDGIVRVVDARDGTALGAMRRVAFPTEIVAVDRGE